MLQIVEQIKEADRVVIKCGYKNIHAVFTKNIHGNIGFHFDSKNIYKSGDIIGTNENKLKVVQSKYYGEKVVAYAN